MKKTEKLFNERVLELVETCKGSVIRKFYCIRDLEFGHWMSQEPFEDLIWTKDIGCRLEFPTREEAEAMLKSFLRWRSGQEVESENDDNPLDLEAA